jgi:hypothetical protein
MRWYEHEKVLHFWLRNHRGRLRREYQRKPTRNLKFLSGVQRKSEYYKHEKEI